MLKVAIDESEEAAFEVALCANDLARMRQHQQVEATEHGIPPMVVTSPPSTHDKEEPSSPRALSAPARLETASGNQSSAASTSEWESSVLTASCETAVVRPEFVCLSTFAGLLLNSGRIPSVGSVDHPKCFPCVPFWKGECLQGRGCRRCHGLHDEALLPRGRGRARQRASRQNARLQAVLRMPTPDPFE